MQPAQPPSLLQRTLGVFVVLALLLPLFLWAGRSLVERPVDNIYLDARRLAALRTFERAIVPLKSLRDYQTPTADLIRRQFAFCPDPLKEQDQRALSARNRRTNPCASTAAAEELACHLGRINSRLHEMSGDRRPHRELPLTERYVVNVDRWIESIRTTQEQPGAQSATERRREAKYQGVACRDALNAARQVAAGDGRLLGLIAWRELSPKSVAARQFAPGQAVRVPGRIIEQRNPWSGVPGCIYYGDPGRHGKVMFVTDRRQSNRNACLAMRPAGTAEKDMAAVSPGTPGDKPENAALHAPPESLDVVLGELDHIRLPWNDLYRAYTAEASAGEATGGANDEGRPVARSHGPNQLDRLKHKVDAGFNVHLTIDPDAQHVVQLASRCYTGDAASCQRIGLASDARFADLIKQMHEKAAVRMAAVALVDIPTGRIEALGSAHTDCFRQEFDGTARRARECPDLPTTPHYEPDRLLNHALFADALPGSIIKPILAAGFLRDPGYRRKIVAERVAADFTRLQDELKGSDSVAFLNRMFCSDKGWTNCDRPRSIQQAAVLLGWDLGCLDPSFRCGRLNVLFGYPATARIRSDVARMPLGASIVYGRLLVEPVSAKRTADLQMMRNLAFEPGHAAACSRGDYYSGAGLNRGWRKCRHGRLVYLESEGWGQGNARTTAVGAAGMMARLAAAANGQASQRLPYLVDRISDANARTFELAAHQFRLADPVGIEIPQEDAALIVQGMISHKSRGTPAGTRTGTAHAACAAVFDAATCNRIDWIAGKTGTPPYGNDRLTLKEIGQKCRLAPPGNAGFGEQQEWWAACSREVPYKWYVAVFRTDDGQNGFNKALAVLTERNWYRSGPQAGKVQSPGDHDQLNISAELAFRIMARMRTGMVEAQAPVRGKS